MSEGKERESPAPVPEGGTASGNDEKDPKSDQGVSRDGKQSMKKASTPLSVKTAESPIAISPISATPASSKTSAKSAKDQKRKAAVEKAQDEFVETVGGIIGAESDEDDDEEATYQPIDLVRVMVPVMLCIVFVILMTQLVHEPDETKPFSYLTPFDTPEADAATTAWQTAANVGILIGVIVVMTFVIVLLYWCYCYKILLAMMAIPVVMVNLVFSWYYLQKFFKALNVPIDHITGALLSFNFGMIGVISILGKTPILLQQFYLIYMCGIMVIMYIRFMPDWTVWAFLAALAVWDLIAVLTPCGPLRILVELIQKREHNFVPAMVYTTAAYTMAENKDPIKKSKPEEKDNSKKDDKDKSKKDDKEGEKKEKRRLRLGLGDFVFYSLLAGKAVSVHLEDNKDIDWNTIMACFVALIVGLLGTIILLVLWKKALPALPISIALGLIFYFSGKYVISPFCSYLSAYQVFI